MSHYRKEKIESRVREILTQLFLFQIKDPRLKGIYINNIRITNDLKIVKVYWEFSITSENKKIEDTQRAFEVAKGFIRKELGRELGVKWTPDIQFFYEPQLI